jgi:predicted PurR-regulated permease PerM
MSISPNIETSSSPSPAAAMPDAAPTQAAVTMTVSPRTILIFVGLVTLTWAIVSVGGTLLVIFVAIFLAMVLSPVVDAAAQRFNLGRGAASSLVVLGIAVLVVLLLLIALAPMGHAVRAFVHNVPKITQEIEHSSIGKQLNHNHLVQTLHNHAAAIASGASKAASGLVGIATSAFNTLLLGFSVIFMTLFLVKDLPNYRSALASLQSNESATRWYRIVDEIITTTSRYMIGNIVISIICGTVYGITAVILGLPYPLALAVIAGILDMVPNVGSLLAGIIIGVVALSVSTTALIVFVVVILVYQQVENYILQPTIIGKAADISGFLVILSVLVWGALFGVVGAIVGVPITAGILTIVKELTADRRARIAATRPSQEPSVADPGTNPQPEAGPVTSLVDGTTPGLAGGG